MSDSMSFRIRPIDAVRAMGASLKNPDDTAQVVRGQGHEAVEQAQAASSWARSTCAPTCRAHRRRTS